MELKGKYYCLQYWRPITHTRQTDRLRKLLFLPPELLQWASDLTQQPLVWGHHPQAALPAPPKPWPVVSPCYSSPTAPNKFCSFPQLRPANIRSVPGCFSTETKWHPNKQAGYIHMSVRRHWRATNIGEPCWLKCLKINLSHWATYSWG